MGLVGLSRPQVVESVVEHLGLDPTEAGLTSPEVLASSIRRAASFSCPTTPRALREAVLQSLRELVDGEDDELRTHVDVMVNSLVAHGDLLEAPIEDPATGQHLRTLFLAAPAYVCLSARESLLLGVRANGLALVDDDMVMSSVLHDGHVRRLSIDDHAEAEAILQQAGLSKVPEEHWLRRPETVSAATLASEYVLRLKQAPPSGAIGDVRLLDPSKPPTYYSGRWRAPTGRDNGKFVIRRPVDFGADAWSFAELKAGSVTQLIDLPIRHQLARGCDEAWHLQAAIDELGGNPQVARVTVTESETGIVDFLSPIPSWAQRRLDVVARPLPRRRGSLISYELAEDCLEEELRVLQETLWIRIDRREEVR